MKFSSSDIIVARATPPGRGGVGVVRISGSDLSQIAVTILKQIPKPRYATLCDFLNKSGTVIDQGIAIYFPSPHSFTGEDVLELHGHGGNVVMDCLIQSILELGARLARPGEFSERAFLNNKIDLTQAEAIADLIEASSSQAARSAVRSLQGEFSKKINNLVEKTIHLRMHVEAAIDFPEEEIDFLTDGKILEKLSHLITELKEVLDCAKQGRVLNEGMKVVIAGYPNAGKSSILNRLSGEDTAIVSHIPGTTRDILRENILIDGMPLHIIDTAGLRDTQNEVEREGIRRAWSEIPNADRILLIIDATEISVNNLMQHPLVQEFTQYHDRLTIIRNKIDLISQSASVEVSQNFAVINLSAKTGSGIELLKMHLKEAMGYTQNTENVFIARRRHLEALYIAENHSEEALKQLTTYRAGELVAEELREVQNALSEITGEFRSDDLLGRIFSSFCIGK